MALPVDVTLPLQARKFINPAHDARPYLQDAESHVVGNLWDLPLARHVALCVNHHDELVQLVKDLACCVTDLSPPGVHAHRGVRDRADALIAEIEGIPE